jgi:prolyl-tRNA editing enzyme YbaK/EbsC (Cys-tRNA(Pro) deacylase)
MLGPLDIHQYLLAHDVHHEIVRLPRPAATAEHLAEVLNLPARRCLTVHPFHAAIATGDVLVVVLAPSDETLDSATLAVALAELLQSRLGPAATLATARADLVSSHTDYLAGHLAPLLLPPDVIVVATQAIVDLERSIVYTATGDGGTALGIRALDLLNLSHALVLPEVSGEAGREAAPIDLDATRAPIHLDAHSVQPVAAFGRSRPMGKPRTAKDEPGQGGTESDADTPDRADVREGGVPSGRSHRGSPLRRPPAMRAAIPVPAAPADTSAPDNKPGSIKTTVATAS